MEEKKTQAGDLASLSNLVRDGGIVQHHYRHYITHLSPARRVINSPSLVEIHFTPTRCLNSNGLNHSGSAYHMTPFALGASCCAATRFAAEKRKKTPSHTSPGPEFVPYLVRSFRSLVSK